MYTVKTPAFVPLFFSEYLWKIQPKKKEVFFSFDDGPTEGVTDFVLDELKKYNFKATFFCVGAQIEKKPNLFKRIWNEGHTIGNHTYHHVHGWFTSPKIYLDEIEKTSNLIQELIGEKPKFFRPPYGKFSPSTRLQILRDYRIVMWDVLAGDFDPLMSPEDCITNILSSFENGSIIVLHDSLKCDQTLKGILPHLLSFFYNNNFSLQGIPEKL